MTSFESLSPVDMLAAWRLMGSVGFLTLSLLMLGLVHNRVGSLSPLALYNSTALVRMFAGVCFAFFTFTMHQFFWWVHEELKALGNCAEAGKEIAEICDLRSAYYSLGPHLTPLFYLCFGLSATLAGAPLITLNFAIEERTGHAIMITILIASMLVGYFAAAFPW